MDGTQTIVAVGDRSPFLEGLGEERKKLDRIIVTVFANGETVFPLRKLVSARSELFRQNLLYRTGKDPFAAFLREAVKLNLEVYAAFELLQWVRPGATTPKTLFDKHLELQELNAQFGCKGVEEGKFASPFHPEVRKALVQLIGEFAQRYPSVAGIVLNCRLSYGEVLGYSEAARVAYIRAKQIDPIDLILGTGQEEMEGLVREWYHWKRDQLSSLVGEIVRAYKAINPHGTVAAVGLANFYRQKLGIRNLTCSDWLHWITEGHLEEVLLDERWSDPKNENLWAAALSLVRKTQRPVTLAPLLNADSDLGAEARTLALQERPAGIIVAVTPNADLEKLLSDAANAVELLQQQKPH